MRFTACRGLVLTLALAAVAACGPDRNDGNWDVADVAHTDTRGDATSTDVPRDTTPPPRDVVTTDTVTTDTRPPPPDVPSTETGGMCPSSCTTNTECQTGCPPPSSGSVCCVFNTCTVVTDPVCPSAMDAGPTGGDSFSFDGFGGGDTGGGFDGFSFDGFSLDGFSFDF